MARKGQKFTNYDYYFINLVLEEYKGCKIMKRLADKYEKFKNTRI